MAPRGSRLLDTAQKVYAKDVCNVLNTDEYKYVGHTMIVIVHMRTVFPYAVERENQKTSLRKQGQHRPELLQLHLQQQLLRLIIPQWIIYTSMVAQAPLPTSMLLQQLIQGHDGPHRA
mmetsp:Transcript_37211/g.80104  ORF Transcript_37211/g.80104 Transcript_37211/m.80104 type:complete len:118 (-) Transcript_37211:273-626(-)